MNAALSGSRLGTGSPADPPNWYYVVTLTFVLVLVVCAVCLVLAATAPAEKPWPPGCYSASRVVHCPATTVAP